MLRHLTILPTGMERCTDLVGLPRPRKKYFRFISIMRFGAVVPGFYWGLWILDGSSEVCAHVQLVLTDRETSSG